MKIILVLATTIAFTALIGPATAQMNGNGVAGACGMNGVPCPQPAPTNVRTFTVKPGDHEKEWTCQGGKSIQSVSVEPKDEIVFISQEKNPSDIWIPAGFRFKDDPKEDVHVTMTCGG